VDSACTTYPDCNYNFTKRKMSKAIISVENTDKGFSVIIRRSEKAIVYPEVLLTYNWARKETTYTVNTGLDQRINDTIYENILKEVEEDAVATNFLQIARLVLGQKTLQYQAEVEALVDEIISM
jgi:hypothetical protein